MLSFEKGDKEMTEELESLLYGRETGLTQKARNCLDKYWTKLKEMEGK